MNLYRKYANKLATSNSQAKRRWCLNKMRKYAHLKDEVDTAPKFVSGQVVKITTDAYGVRYKGTKATVIGPATVKGQWKLQAARRKSPLLVDEKDLLVA